jgi:hypothetical protein
MRKMTSIVLIPGAGNRLRIADSVTDGQGSGQAYREGSYDKSALTHKTDAVAGLTVPPSAVVPSWPRVFPGL